MESVLGQKLERQHIDGRSLLIVAEAAEFLGILKRFKQSSGSRSSHSIYPGPTMNENENRTKKANTLIRLFFVFFISCLTKTA